MPPSCTAHRPIQPEARLRGCYRHRILQHPLSPRGPRLVRPASGCATSTSTVGPPTATAFHFALDSRQARAARRCLLRIGARSTRPRCTSAGNASATHTVAMSVPARPLSPTAAKGRARAKARAKAARASLTIIDYTRAHPRPCLRSNRCLWRHLRRIRLPCNLLITPHQRRPRSTRCLSRPRSTCCLSCR